MLHQITRWTMVVAYCALVLSQARPTRAANLFWNTPGTDNWDTDARWDVGGTEPTAGDAAFIGLGGTAQVTLAGEVAQELNIGHSGGTNNGDGNLDVIGGDLTVTADLFLGSASSRSGIVVQTGGNVDIGGDLRMAFDGSSSGNYNFTGGTLTFSGGASSDFLIHREGAIPSVPGRLGFFGPGMVRWQVELTFQLQIFRRRGGVCLLFSGTKLACARLRQISR